MKEAVPLIRSAQRAYVASHLSPDGDAVGSVLGLGHALRELGLSATVALPEPAPTGFDFLPGVEGLVQEPPSGEEDLLIVLDCTDPSRLGDLCRPALFTRLPVINIDHHATNDLFGTVNLVDARATSTAELVAGLVEALEVPFSPSIATCLLFGLVADTQGFRTPNTTPASLGCASRLLAAGADLQTINRRLFLSAPIAALCLEGEILARAQLDGGIVWSVVDPALIAQCGARQEDAGGVVNRLAAAREARVSVLFKEWAPDETEVSIRSKPGVDISAAALRLGGGGHPQAAGATLRGPRQAVRARVLEELKRTLEGG